MEGSYEILKHFSGLSRTLFDFSGTSYKWEFGSFLKFRGNLRTFPSDFTRTLLQFFNLLSVVKLFSRTFPGQMVISKLPGQTNITGHSRNLQDAYELSHGKPSKVRFWFKLLPKTGSCEL